MEEGESQGGKIREILEANDIKKFIIELLKSKKRLFFFFSNTLALKVLFRGCFYSEEHKGLASLLKL